MGRLIFGWAYKWGGLYSSRIKKKGSPIPFLITESRKIIWPFHVSREI